MRRVGHLAIGLCVGLALAGPAHAEELKRLTLRQDLLGLEAVGRVDIGEFGYCTGTLIAPDLVLTAAHCLFDGETQIDPAELKFRAGLRDGEAVGESGVTRTAVLPGFAEQSAEATDRVRRDVALLELASPIPSATAAPFAVAPLPSGPGRVGVVSFARGRDAALSQQRDCGIVGWNAGLMAFDCDVDFGSSGAPVFEGSGRRPSIISIISSGYREDGRTISVGMELPGAVAELRRAMRTGLGVTVAGGAPDIKPRRIRPGDAASDAGGARFVRP